MATRKKNRNANVDTNADEAEFRVTLPIYRFTAAIFFASSLATVAIARVLIPAGETALQTAATGAAGAVLSLVFYFLAPRSPGRAEPIIPLGFWMTVANGTLFVASTMIIAAKDSRTLGDPALFASLALGFPLFGIVSCIFVRSRRLLIMFLAAILAAFAILCAIRFCRQYPYAPTADSRLFAMAALSFAAFRLTLLLCALLLGAALHAHLRAALVHKQDYLEKLAFFDQETGLPNARGLISTTDALTREADETGGLIVLAGIRLLKLEEMSERLGHESMIGWIMRFAGEFSAALDLWARRRNIPATPITVSRIEYSLLIFPIPIDAATYREEGEIARAAACAVSDTLKNLNSDALIGFTGAYAVYPLDGRVASELLSNMLGVLRRAPPDSRGKFVPFDGTAFGEYIRVERLKEQILSDSFRAEIRFVYQPKTNPATGACEGFEALARWTSAIFGPVSPGEFIPLAEQIGAIETVTEKSLEGLLAFVNRARERGLVPARIAFNLSPMLLSRSYANTLAEWIAANDLASWVEVEITEGLLLNATESVAESLQAIRDSGATIAIDDFGTGYSNLGYLRHFSASVLKIDKRFIDGLPDDEGSAKLVTAIVQMAKAFDLKVVAEGVETEGQTSWLAKADCDLIQGYWFSKPLEADAALEWLAKNGLHETAR
jgi:EAL domain-containing protein (putative c-di-GMP-specific phosphodiesterase class I)